MIKKDIIKSLIRDFHHRPLPELVTRDLTIPTNIKKSLPSQVPGGVAKPSGFFRLLPN